MLRSGLFLALCAAVLAGCQIRPEEPKLAPPAATFTVTFNGNGSAAEIPPQTVSRGRRVEKPDPDPVKGTDIFLGWYNEDRRWYFDTGAVTGTTTLTAKWAAPGDTWYTVTFMDGTDTVATLRVPDGEIIHFYMVVPRNQNKVFTGWKNSGIEVQAEPVTEDMILTAGWNEAVFKWGDGSYQPMRSGDVLRHYANSENGFAIGNDNAKGMVAFTRSGWWHYMMFRRYTKLNESILPAILYTKYWWWEPEQGNAVLINNPADAGRDTYLDWDRYIRWGLNVALDTGYLSATDQAIFNRGNAFNRGPHFVLYDEEGAIRTHYWKFRMSPSFLEDDVERPTVLFRLGVAVGPEGNTDLLILVANGYKNTLQLLHNNQGMGRVKTTVVFDVPITEIAGKWTAIELTMHFRDISPTRPGRENGYIYVKLTDMEGRRVLAENGMFADMWRSPEMRNEESGQWEERSDFPTRDTQAIHPGFGLQRSIAEGRPPKIAVDWSDYYLIDRSLAGYRFPTGYDPADAGPVPVRDSIE